MQTNTSSKYLLRDLHEAIDLFDRKIEYCRTSEKFESSVEREKELQKLTTKRGSLVKNALLLRGQGVETGDSFLPRSFKSADFNEAVPEPAAPATGKRRRVAAGR